MRVYNRNKAMLYLGGADFPPEGILFTDYAAELDDELASRLVLERPEMFKLTPYADQVETEYDPNPPLELNVPDANEPVFPPVEIVSDTPVSEPPAAAGGSN